VRNVPAAGDSGFDGSEEQKVAPKDYLLEMLNPTLEILPDFDKARGSAVTRAWTEGPSVVRMEMQSKELCRSAMRVVDGLVFFGRKLETRIVE